MTYTNKHITVTTDDGSLTIRDENGNKKQYPAGDFSQVASALYMAGYRHDSQRQLDNRTEHTYIKTTVTR